MARKLKFQTRSFETVHTISDWYDGARAGIADFEGKPHYYQCELSYGPDEDHLLTPLDEETFQLAMEDWKIWLQWEAAFDKGLTSLKTHPALPEQEARHKELLDLLATKLLIDSTSAIKAKARFKYGKNSLVKWTLKK